MKTFEPIKEVPNLELCKKLKELGYPQEGGGWYWDFEDYKLAFIWAEEVADELIKAPTCRELGEWLPQNWNIVSIQYKNGRWGVSSHEVEEWRMWEADTEANARAKMLMWLVENRYVKFTKTDQKQKSIIQSQGAENDKNLPSMW
ncbi:MAG: hypothetical protein DRP11_04655 [Candidatus Aenigmatarchaeota archaeon]|nr:MAG: hypothetical protein DRP11_04655 [Candidatus Aenigmarchaeota archaeon]